MAKKPTSQRGARSAKPQQRQTKVQAAQTAAVRGGATNKIMLAGIVAIIAIIATVGAVIWSQRTDQKAAGSGNQNPPAGATVEQGYRAFADAKLKPGVPTVVVYEDFQCPSCAQFEASLGGTIEDLARSGDLDLRYHMVNFLDTKFGVEQSTPVANGAFCAADQGKWQQFHDAAYAGQHEEGKSVTREQVAAFAKAAGVPDLGSWSSCLAAGKYSHYLTESNTAATTSGVSSTPTVRINGAVQQLSAIATPESFANAVKTATK